MYDPSTQRQILEFYERHHAGEGRGGWRVMGEILGTSKGAAYDIAHENRGLTQKQRDRFYWWVDYQASLPEVVSVYPCPSCGVAHTHDCAEEVLVPRKKEQPSSQASRPKSPRKSYWRPCLPPEMKGIYTSEELTALIQEAKGIDW